MSYGVKQVIRVVLRISGWIVHSYDAVSLSNKTKFLVFNDGVNKKMFGANPKI